MLAEVAGRGRVRAFDIAELNPPYDASGPTARLATWLITHFLGEIFGGGCQRPPRQPRP